MSVRMRVHTCGASLSGSDDSVCCLRYQIQDRVDLGGRGGGGGKKKKKRKKIRKRKGKSLLDSGEGGKHFF